VQLFNKNAAKAVDIMYNDAHIICIPVSKGHAARMLENGGNSMEITNITIRKMGSEGKMKAIVSVTFDHSFVVHDIKVIEGNNGYFIAMPSRKTQDGEFKDIVHPINTEFREKLSGEVLQKYYQALELYEIEAAEEAAAEE
jgi:stage V sporulation protein G